MCISGCPYKKIYYNWKSGKSEKCIFCYPRIEAGMPTICSETCVGRIRYLGVLLYDADRIHEVASTPNEHDLYPRQLEMFLDPHDPGDCRRTQAGIADSVISAAQHPRCTSWRLTGSWRCRCTEYRTLPMVWYVPPVADPERRRERQIAMNGVLPDVDSLRIPVRYLANLLTAGDEAPVKRALKRLLAMRVQARAARGRVEDLRALEDVGLSRPRPRKCTATWRLPTTRTGSSSPAPTAKRP